MKSKGLRFWRVAVKYKGEPSVPIQAQMDYFGSHTYKIIAMEWIFHTEWESKNVKAKK